MTKHSYVGTKSILKAGIQVYLLILVNPLFFDPVRLPNTDPDPGEAKSMRIRIQITSYFSYIFEEKNSIEAFSNKFSL